VVAVADSLNLRFCGIDLACADLTRPDDEYFVYEANGTPGLDLFSIHGDSQAQLVRDLYARVLTSLP
jgi:glutathione synthase/RimK-type ligase-like ATP-grasp enzyme